MWWFHNRALTSHQINVALGQTEVTSLRWCDVCLWPLPEGVRPGRVRGQWHRLGGYLVLYIYLISDCFIECGRHVERGRIETYIPLYTHTTSCVCNETGCGCICLGVYGERILCSPAVGFSFITHQQRYFILLKKLIAH